MSIITDVRFSSFAQFGIQESLRQVFVKLGDDLLSSELKNYHKSLLFARRDELYSIVQKEKAAAAPEKPTWSTSASAAGRTSSRNNALSLAMKDLADMRGIDSVPSSFSDATLPSLGNTSSGSVPDP